ncbi:MAG: hypothetical protein AAB152_10150 [Candidatus Coatesbacteria bacterium]
MVLNYVSFNDALSPLRYIDLPSVYSEYATLIDFFVYLVIFVGLARTILERRFEGRGGKAVVIGIGTALAMGLALAESRVGFSLLSLGPVAGTIIVSLLAIVLFNLFLHLGASMLTSALSAFFLLYLTMATMTPFLWGWIQTHVPLFNAAGILSGMSLLYVGVMTTWSALPANRALAALSSMDSNEKKVLSIERAQVTALEPSLRAEIQEDRSAKRQLSAIYRDLEKVGLTTETTSHLHEEIRRAKDRQFLVLQKLDYIITINRKLKAFDLGLFHSLKARYEALPEPAKTNVRRAIQQERVKVFEEGKIEDLAADARRALSEYDTALQMADTAISSANAKQAMACLLKAIRSDRRVDRCFVKLQKAEHQILTMIPKKIEQTR